MSFFESKNRKNDHFRRSSASCYFETNRLLLPYRTNSVNTIRYEESSLPWFQKDFDFHSNSAIPTIQPPIRRCIRCQCPNCTDERNGKRILPIGAKREHNCPFPDCDKVYGKTSHLKVVIIFPSILKSTSGAYSLAFGRASVPLCLAVLWQELHSIRRAAETYSNSHGRETIQMRLLR